MGEQRLRSELFSPLQAMACDVCLGLRHDLETPHAVLHAVARLVEDRQKP